MKGRVHRGWVTSSSQGRTQTNKSNSRVFPKVYLLSFADRRSRTFILRIRSTFELSDNSSKLNRYRDQHSQIYIGKDKKHEDLIIFKVIESIGFLRAKKASE